MTTTTNTNPFDDNAADVGAGAASPTSASPTPATATDASTATPADDNTTATTRSPSPPKEPPAPSQRIDSSTPTSPAGLNEPTPNLLQRPATGGTQQQQQQQPEGQEGERPVSPQVAALRAIFPDFDDGLLQSVLQSVGNDQDRAVEALLGMSDPEYKADHTQPSQQEEQQRPMTQEELDEQLARRLVMEEEQQQHMIWQQQYGQQEQQQPGYGPQRRATMPPERDTMTELGEQFSKFAETSKRTFGSLLNKARTKLHEFDQQRTQNASSSSGDTFPYDQGQNPYPQAGPPPTVSPSTRPISTSSSSPPPASRPSLSGQAPQGYDTTPTNAGITSSSSPPTTGPPIDGGKIGILPKRPVSLLGPSQTSSPAPAEAENTPHIASGTSIAVNRDSDSDDGLEYVENPFETDSRKR